MNLNDCATLKFSAEYDHQNPQRIDVHWIGYSEIVAFNSHFLEEIDQKYLSGLKSFDKILVGDCWILSSGWSAVAFEVVEIDLENEILFCKRRLSTGVHYDRL